MKIAIIAPTAMLEKYCTTGTQYCLPALLVEDKEYAEFYRERAKAGDIIILDSRKVGWRRVPEDYSTVKTALRLIVPYVVIYPSYMYDARRTIKIAREFLDEVSIVGSVCVEGTNIEELISCIDEVKPVFGYAIPSHIYNTATSLPIDKSHIYLDHHLHIEELQEPTADYLVTSLPIRLGLEGRLITDYLPSPPSLTFDETEDNFPLIIEKNIKEMLEYYERHNDISRQPGTEGPRQN